MNDRSLQQLSSRSRLLSAKPQLYRFCVAIVLAGLLFSAGELMSPSALAQGVLTDAALISSQNVLVGQIAEATVQIPPSVATRLRQALSKRTKIPAAKLKIVEATPKTWANGCLGLAKADEICTQALVEGWRVVFSNGNQRWLYRADKQARVYRLEP